MQRVLNSLKSNHTTLFLGAGSSMDVGGPSGNKLLSDVIRKFSDVKFSNDKNFFDVCKNIIDSENHSRTELEKFIIKQLEGLYPDEKHNNIVSLPWKCIFTTNYDTVLERIHPDKFKGRIFRPIKERKPEVELKRQDVLYYIKMFGSIDAPYSEEGYPILSRTDYNTSFISRNSYYKILGDCIRQGPIVFLGYSFEDGLVFDIMAELQEVIGPDIIRPSFAISPNKPSIDVQRSFAKYKIIHIDGTLEQFVSSANKELKDKKFEFNYSEKTIHVHGIPIDIPSSIERPSKEHFTFLHSSSIESEIKDPKKFFSGEDMSMYPYLKEWDFIREVYSFDKTETCKEYGSNVKDCLKKHVFKFINDTKPDNNGITILTGAAGCGKTVILNRLAFDWYKSGLPVIFIQPQGANIDFRQIDSFIGFIEEDFNNKTEKSQILPRPRTLIICDHASSLYGNYLYLFNFLTSRGRLVSMVIADRENLLRPIVEKNLIVYSIPETISKKEVERFKQYLFSIGIIETEADLYSLIDDTKINSSFFALMYTIIDEAKRPLNNIIHDTYIRLNDWPKQVYEYVCLFNYYNINPNEELLIRATIDSYVTFRKEIEEGQLKKVIFSEGAEWDNIDYRVHHPIIALRTVKMEFNDPSIRIQKFLEILNKINPSLRHEIRKIERLLVFEIGPNSQDKEIPTSLKKEIFELVSSKIESRSIYHHYALLELEGDDKNFAHAKQLLDKALAIKHNTTERDELILTSFGKFFSQKGYQLEGEGKLEEALEAYDLAESYFKKGRNKFFKNVYSYHGQIVLNRRRAEKAVEALEKVKLLSKAMELCEEAISNLSSTDHPEFFKQEAQIMYSLGNLKEFDSIVEKLANEYKNALGYQLKASILFKKSFAVSDEKEKTQMLEEAHKLTKKGLAIENNEIGLLRLEAKIGIELFPTDTDTKYKILKTWYDFSDQADMKLLFQYGIVLFEKNYYEDSKKIFDDLDFQSHGLPQRSSIFQSYFIKDNIKLKEYRGKVKQLDSDGRKGYIECTSLPNLKYDIKFFPMRYSPVVDDYVVFNIGFNMRGIFAFDVKKD